MPNQHKDPTDRRKKLKEFLQRPENKDHLEWMRSQVEKNNGGHYSLPTMKILDKELRQQYQQTNTKLKMLREDLKYLGLVKEAKGRSSNTTGLTTKTGATTGATTIHTPHHNHRYGPNIQYNPQYFGAAMNVSEQQRQQQWFQLQQQQQQQLFQQQQQQQQWFQQQWFQQRQQQQQQQQQQQHRCADHDVSNKRVSDSTDSNESGLQRAHSSELRRTGTGSNEDDNEDDAGGDNSSQKGRNQSHEHKEDDEDGAHAGSGGSPLPSNQIWAFDVPKEEQIIYNSDSLSKLPEGILKSMAIGSLGTHDETSFLLDLKKKSTAFSVSGGGPDYTVVAGDFFELFRHPTKEKKIHNSIASLQRLISEAISSSGKWSSSDRKITDASSMSTNNNEPQDCHSDWKMDWQGKEQTIAEENYPLSILVPVTKAGSYVSVWDPEKEGYAYVVHVRFGELIMFDPRCLHGGNIGGRGEYKRLHCFCVTDEKHSTPGGPHFHCEGNYVSLQNPKLSPEQEEELLAIIHQELSLKTKKSLTRALLDSYLKSKGTVASNKLCVAQRAMFAYSVSTSTLQR